MFFFFKTKDAARITATLACHCVAPTLCVFIAQLVVVARWSSRYLEGEFDELVLVLNASFCLPAGQEEVPGHHPQLHGGARHRARHQHRAPAQLRQEPRHPERPRPAVPPQGNQGQSPPAGWKRCVTLGNLAAHELDESERERFGPLVGRVAAQEELKK